MLELPERATLARQLDESVRGLRVVDAIAGSTTHKFAFFTGDPADYAVRLKGRMLTKAEAFGGILD